MHSLSSNAQSLRVHLNGFSISKLCQAAIAKETQWGGSNDNLMGFDRSVTPTSRLTEALARLDIDFFWIFDPEPYSNVSGCSTVSLKSEADFANLNEIIMNDYDFSGDNVCVDQKALNAWLSYEEAHKSKQRNIRFIFPG